MKIQGLRCIGLWLVIAFSTGPAMAQGGPPPVLVVLDAARMETVEVWREVTGELRAMKRAAIASRQPGLVVELNVEEGQRLEAGQLVAKLDSAMAMLEASEKRSEADAKAGIVKVREAELQKAQRDWARYEGLVGKESVSSAEIDIARTGPLLAAARLEEAKGDLASARAAVSVADQMVSEMTLTAPFNGYVVRKRADIGEWVDKGGAVAEVVSLEQLEARLNVPESLVPSLLEMSKGTAGGASARIRFLGLGLEVEGTVDAVWAEADVLSRLVPVRVKLANPDGLFRPGMSIVGLVRAAGTTEPRLTVSKDAILRDDAGEFVYFSAGGTAVVARVRSRYAVGDRVVVDATLPPGAELVVRGNERLRPGATLQPEAPASPGITKEVPPKAD